MNIYFLRHGETEENKKERYYGNMDISLNSLGIEQGNKAQSFLKNIKFDKVYVSEKKRTLEMAKLALNNEYINPLVDNRINEMNLGLFEGKNYKELQKLFPKEWEFWSKDWKNYSPPDGESYIEFYERVSNFLEEIKASTYENILIVTHGGVIRTVYCYILGGCLDFFWKFSSKNGDVTLIKYEYENWFIDSISHV